MILLDFFECKQQALLSGFSDYFGIDVLTAKDYFGVCDREKIDARMVINDLRIDLNGFDSRKINFIGHHISTTNKIGISRFREQGVYNLKQMLCGKNSLSAFLAANGISIDYLEKEITVDRQTYSLAIDNDKCVSCLKGNKEVCNSYFGCELKKKLKVLDLKLYKDGGTTEFFISGSMDAKKHYSTVSRCPEILYTLDEIVSATKGNTRSCSHLRYEWQTANPICILISFEVCLFDMETFNPINKHAWFDEYGDCILGCGFSLDDYILGNVPKRVFDNFYFIRHFLSFYYWGNSESYGSLLADLYVRPEQIHDISII